MLRAAARVARGSGRNSYLLAAVAEDDAALDGLLFSDPSQPPRSAGRRPGEPWAHVPASTRVALEAARERAYHAWLAADRGEEMAGEGPPPHGPAGCLVCGADSAPWWRRVLTAALTPGPGHVEGHLCPACSAAHDVVGALGPSLVERAWLRSPGVDWPEHLRPPALRPWVSTGRPPGQPWSWVDARPPGPEPTAADLAAELAEVRAELARLRQRAPR